MKKIVIIGGGISGLSFAHYCAEAGMYVTLLEKTERVGGAIETKMEQDSILEMGAHTCYNSYGNFIHIGESIGLMQSISQRSKHPYKVWKSGALKSILSQFNIIELLFSVKNILTVKRDNRTVSDYFSKLLGKKNYQNLFHYFMQAVVCQNADNFPAQLVFRKKPRNKKYPKSYFFKGGLQQVVDKVSHQESVAIECGVTTSMVKATESGVCITTENRGEFRADYVVVATPPEEAGRFLTEWTPQLATILSSIPTALVESVGVSLPRESLAIPLVSGVVGLGAPFYSMVSSDAISESDSKRRSFVFHFKPNCLTESEKKGEIAQVLGVEQKELGSLIIKENRLPTFASNHLDTVDKLTELMPSKLFLIGNYFIGSSIEDSIQRSRDEFRRLIKKILPT
ncbi:MAG: FAD-dependent oxidoreductase [Fibrobacterales bacterium]